MSSMQEYLKFLLEDIQESAINRDDNAEYKIISPASIPEKYDNLPYLPMLKTHQWLNLPLDIFPSADRWNDEQLLELCVYLRLLLEHYNINVEIPNHIPYDIVYTYLLKALDTYTTCNPDDENNQDTIVFCTYNEDCPFGKHCARQNDYSCDN